MNKIKEVAQKLVTMSLTALPLAVLADISFDPMSREEWERHQEFLRTFSSPSPSLLGCVLAFLTGGLLIISLSLIVKKCSVRLGSRRELKPMATIFMVMVVAIFVQYGCLCIEVVCCPFSTLLSKLHVPTKLHVPKVHEESYEEYVFHETHCRKCGSSLDRKGSCRICRGPKGTETCPYCHGTGLKSGGRLCNHCEGWGKGSFPETAATTAKKIW